MLQCVKSPITRTMRFEIIPVTRYQQNCSVLWCEQSRRAAVIDPGGELWRIEEFLEWEELVLEVILITHAHQDHAGGAAELARLTSARIEGPHQGDEMLVKGLGEQLLKYPLKGEPYSPQRWLVHGDRVRFGNEVLEVLHCPGHARGHVAYFHQASRWAFVGDILFCNAIGAWEHPHGNLRDLVTSIRSRLFPLGDDVRFVPGHGPTSSFGEERKNNPFVGDDALARWKNRPA